MECSARLIARGILSSLTEDMKNICARKLLDGMALLTHDFLHFRKNSNGCVLEIKSRNQQKIWRFLFHNCTQKKLKIPTEDY